MAECSPDELAMELELNTHPFWLVSVLLILAAATYVYYFRPASSMIPLDWRRVLSVLRWAVLSALAFYLFEPVVRYEKFLKEKPLFTILRDRSTSAESAVDSAQYCAEITPILNQIEAEWQDAYEVVYHSFDRRFHDDESTLNQGSQHGTNLSETLKGWRSAYSGRKHAGVLWITDGIYNAGSDPLYALQAMDPPMHALVLGDTAVYRDVFIAQVDANEEAFAGQPFPIQVRVQARGMALNGARLLLQEDGETLQEALVTLRANAVETYTFTHATDSIGTHRYRVVLQTDQAEKNKWNNRSSVAVRVHDEQQRIIIRYGALTPDIAAFRRTLEATGRFRVDVESLDEAPELPGSEDLIVVFQPVGELQVQKAQAYWRASVPVLMVTGEMNQPAALNRIQNVLRFRSDAATSMEAITPRFSDAFGRFQLPAETRQWMESDLPPIRVPFGTIQVAPQASVWMYQTVGSVESTRPLAVFAPGSDGVKRAVFIGSGYWQWRMWNYRSRGDVKFFETWLFRAAQYLLSSAPSSPFEVQIPQRIDFNTPVSCFAYYRDATGNPITGADVSIELTDSAQRTYPFDFSPDDDRYLLQLGQLPPGKYNYRAQARYGSDSAAVRGSFEVAIDPMELRDTRARADVLLALAAETGGLVSFPEDSEEWLSQLLSQPQVPSTLVSEVRFDDLIDIRWILFALVALLTAEWFLRKYFGSY